MAKDPLRPLLVELLVGGHAHAAPEEILRGIRAEHVDARPFDALRSLWEEVEHLRLAQEDILRYTLEPSWKSHPWPEAYWPKAPCANVKRFRASVKAFLNDLERLATVARDPAVDLHAPIAHAVKRSDGSAPHSPLREILLAADHNAYHLGQIVSLRKLLGAWPK